MARSVWFTGNTSNTTCEATSREGCRRLKAAGKARMCFICAWLLGQAQLTRRSAPPPFHPSHAYSAHAHSLPRTADHNMELALEWLESQRAVMYDPSKADLFLQYTDGHGHKTGKIYNEARAEGDQFCA